MRNAGLPFTVSLRTDAGTIAASGRAPRSTRRRCFIAEVPKVFANTTRARAPAIDRVDDLAQRLVVRGNRRRGAVPARWRGRRRGGGRGRQHRRNVPRRRVVHVATQWSAESRLPETASP